MRFKTSISIKLSRLLPNYEGIDLKSIEIKFQVNRIISE